MCLIQLWIGLLAHLRYSSSPTCIVIVLGRHLIFYFFKQGKLLFLCFICKKKYALVLFSVDFVLFYVREFMLSYFSKQGQISDLMLSIQGRICDMLPFRTWQNLCHSILPWRTNHDLIPSFDTADLVLFDFSLYWRQNLCCLTLPGNAELGPCLLCHINIWISI